MKITKEIEEFINLTITEHMGKRVCRLETEPAVCDRTR